MKLWLYLRKNGIKTPKLMINNNNVLLMYIMVLINRQ